MTQLPLDPAQIAWLEAQQAKVPAWRKSAKQGYADIPGTGPEGRQCRHCRHAIAHHMAKTFYKCRLVRATGSIRTDILIATPACRKFEERDA